MSQSSIVEKGVTVLRYESITTTEIYTHLADEDAREAVYALVSRKVSR